MNELQILDQSLYSNENYKNWAAEKSFLNSGSFSDQIKQNYEQHLDSLAKKNNWSISNPPSTPLKPIIGPAHDKGYAQTMLNGVFDDLKYGRINYTQAVDTFINPDLYKSYSDDPKKRGFYFLRSFDLLKQWESLDKNTRDASFNDIKRLDDYIKSIPMVGNELFHRGGSDSFHMQRQFTDTYNHDMYDMGYVSRKDTPNRDFWLHPGDHVRSIVDDSVKVVSDDVVTPVISGAGKVIDQTVDSLFSNPSVLIIAVVVAIVLLK